LTCRALLLLALLLVGLASTAAAQEQFRYPPPELGPEYKEPVTLFPPLHEILPPALDVLVLVAAIALASFFAHKTRSRRSLVLLAIASLVWFGFIREGCVCPVGSLQNVAEAIANPDAPILAGTILFFVIPLMATLLMGQTFCAAVCPLCPIQELVLLRPTTVPGWLAAALAILPHVYLVLAVLFAVTGSAYVICRYDPFVGLFRLGATSNMLVVSGCLVLISVFVGRPYCRFLCPYGVLLGWVSRLSWRRVTITPDACPSCRLCEDSCPYGAITEPNVGVVKGSRFRGRRALIGYLVVTPVIMLGLGWFGAGLGPVLATGNPRVWLAEQIHAEETGLTRETTDGSDAFRASGGKIDELMEEADRQRAAFTLGGWLGGSFLGLMIALKLIGLSVRRTRTEYEADRDACVACGRCFEWCPVEHERRQSGLVPEMKA
jgi:NAD-dependent dihydropyrimidine dehydrogenase PreA subunit